MSLTMRLEENETYQLFLVDVLQFKTDKEFLAKAPYTSVAYANSTYYGPLDSSGLRKGVGLSIFNDESYYLGAWGND